MDDHDIVQLDQKSREELLKKVPPPDRYILLSSSNSKTEEQLQEQYKQTKEAATKAQPNIVAQPIDFKSPEFQEFAHRWVENKIQELMADEEILKDSQMVFVLGSPGAGKSSAIKTEKAKYGAFHADADKIKTDLSLPLEKGGLGLDVNHPQIHAASGYIMKNMLIPALISNKINFIQEKIGDEIGKMLKYTEDYKKQGYNVDLTLVHCDYNVCRQRNCSRCLGSIRDGEPPRLVEDDAIVNYGNSPAETYLYLMTNHGELYNNGTAYCSDGPDKDHPPQLLEGLQFEHGERVQDEFVQEYEEKGRDLKIKAIIVATKKTMEELDPTTAEQVKQEVRAYLNGSTQESNFPEIIGKINQRAEGALIKILNPVKNYRAAGQQFDMQGLEADLLETMEASTLAPQTNENEEFTA